MKQMFTALEIATALGKSKRGVLAALRGLKPQGTKAVRGQLTDCWEFSELPERLRQGLQQCAKLRGYRDVNDLLTHPPSRWEPPIPIADVADQHIERAARLRNALRRSILFRDDPAAGTVQLCFADFRKEFPAASERHWRRLLRRTIQRDAGEENFEDLALYLDELLTARVAPGCAKAVAMDESDRLILDVLSTVKTPVSPTLAEATHVWTVVCEQIAARTAAIVGNQEKRIRREIFSLLIKSGVTLAKNPKALKEAIKLKFRKWNAGGRTFNALVDHRPDNSGRVGVPIPEDDRRRLIAEARINHGGSVSGAYRDLRDRGELSQELLLSHLGNPRNKSHVPTRIREAVTPDVKRLKPIHHGPREHRLKGAYHTRDWSGVAAGDWFQSDDKTLDLYFWAETPRGVELMRGQFLPMVDERTSFVLGFVLILARNYDSLSIRSLITRVCSEHGLPRRGFSFENGLWKTSKILTGDKRALGWETADRGLRSLGIEFRHAQLPRGKVIEGIFPIFDRRMAGLPGYVGRDEKRECYERVARAKLDVESGRIPANKDFLSAQQVEQALFDILEEFNDTPQTGRRLAGLSPREGWHQLQSESRTRFDARCAYILAHDCRKLLVRANGITIAVGKQRFNYKGVETGRRVGEEVLGWFNPDTPEYLPCTDLKQQGVFTVPRSYEVPAVGATREELAAENGKIAAHNDYATRLYGIIKNTLPDRSFRLNLVNAATAHVAEQITVQQERLTEERKVSTRRRASVSTKAARLGIAVAALDDPQGAQTEEALARMSAVLLKRKARMGTTT